MKSFLAVVLLLLASGAQAAVLADPQWQSWLDDDKLIELAQAADARLVVKPDDVQATVALAMVALQGGDAQALDASVAPLQACVVRDPNQALCHFALGSVQTERGLMGGLFSALREAGTVKAELGQAVARDPKLYEARTALVNFYLLVPEFAGGSAVKARELADAAQPPAVAQFLRATIFAHNKRWPEMAREMDGIPWGSSLGFRMDVANLWLQLATEYMFERQYDKANAICERLQREQPTLAAGAFGLARVQDAQGRYADAVKLFQRAGTLGGTQFLPIDYRMGLSAMAGGDKALARAALRRVIASKRAIPKYRDDAKKRLSELG